MRLSRYDCGSLIWNPACFHAGAARSVIMYDSQWHYLIAFSRLSYACCRASFVSTCKDRQQCLPILLSSSELFWFPLITQRHQSTLQTAKTIDKLLLNAPTDAATFTQRNACCWVYSVELSFVTYPHLKVNSCCGWSERYTYFWGFYINFCSTPVASLSAHTFSLFGETTHAWSAGKPPFLFPLSKCFAFY